MSSTTTAPPAAAPSKEDRRGLADLWLRSPTLGPLIALAIAVVIFSLTSSTFMNIDNMSLVLQQTIVIATLALGQTLVILTAGIDLANAAIMVLGSLLFAKLAAQGQPPLLALVAGFAVCTVIGAVSGALVTRLKLPPFIVTLGLLTVVTALGRLYSDGNSWPVTSDLLGYLGKGSYLFGQFYVTPGMFVMLAMFGIVWYALSHTAWGKHVYAVGNDEEAARLTGIHVRQTLFSVYVVAGLIYAVAAWQALGRIPNADPNAFQTGNLDSITAVVIGGTSLFGGRGGVWGTLVGALIVAVLRSGLTQAGIDSLYQDVATGLLVIAAVAFDQWARRRAL
ncbi:ABC transporter permease [Arsenicicoccus piscis]|uniref:Sugar ABC transporter permease n=1 Tax=Arsenicicoccus piscis TaxID=673954 RepID=A0ABQ6HV04_9MICO|nr:ABC transporter permease [Arsenicicoccus piscis]MCH8626715.1 ABC transporter permease [Arsenicicoccus piscis]GMA21390.1 sugar ABC transporter permease [Arsenicicoccus piscis]